MLSCSVPTGRYGKYADEATGIVMGNLGYWWQFWYSGWYFRVYFHLLPSCVAAASWTHTKLTISYMLWEAAAYSTRKQVEKLSKISERILYHSLFFPLHSSLRRWDSTGWGCIPFTGEQTQKLNSLGQFDKDSRLAWFDSMTIWICCNFFKAIFICRAESMRS
jgi:hypothetical protein